MNENILFPKYDEDFKKAIFQALKNECGVDEYEDILEWEDYEGGQYKYTSERMLSDCCLEYEPMDYMLNLFLDKLLNLNKDKIKTYEEAYEIFNNNFGKICEVIDKTFEEISVDEIKEFVKKIK